MTRTSARNQAKAQDKEVAAPSTSPSKSKSKGQAKASAKKSPAATPAKATTATAATATARGKKRAEPESEANPEKGAAAESGAKEEEEASAEGSKAKKPRASKSQSKSTSTTTPSSTPTSEQPPSPSPAAPTQSFIDKYGDNLTHASLPRANFDASCPPRYAAADKAKGVVRIASWNITSLSSSEKKGLFAYLSAESSPPSTSSSSSSSTDLEAAGPDILVLTETKVNEAPLLHPKLSRMYKHQSWGVDTSAKSYAGVAILAKEGLEPLRKTIGIPKPPPAPAGEAEADADADAEEEEEPWDAKRYNGRVIAWEYPTLHLVATYATNAGESLSKAHLKRAWHRRFYAYLRRLDRHKPVVWCGDLNVVRDQRDLSMGKKKWDKHPGYTRFETDAYRELLLGDAATASAAGAGTGEGGTGPAFIDAWRHLHPEAVGHFTFYSFRGMCRSKGIGWRLDTFVLSARLLLQQQEEGEGEKEGGEGGQGGGGAGIVKQCEIRHEIYGPSDHVPVICDLQGPL